MEQPDSPAALPPNSPCGTRYLCWNPSAFSLSAARRPFISLNWFSFIDARRSASFGKCLAKFHVSQASVSESVSIRAGLDEVALAAGATSGIATPSRTLHRSPNLSRGFAVASQFGGQLVRLVRHFQVRNPEKTLRDKGERDSVLNFHHHRF